MRKSKQFKKVVEMSKWYIDRVRKDNERIRTCKERMTDTYYCANYYTPIKPTLTQQYTHVIDNCKYSALDKHIGFDEMDEERRALFYTKVKELRDLFEVGGWKE